MRESDSILKRAAMVLTLVGALASASLSYGSWRQQVTAEAETNRAQAATLAQIENRLNDLRVSVARIEAVIEDQQQERRRKP